MTKAPKDLIGKDVVFFINGETRGRKGLYHGTRKGRVVKVDTGPRKGFTGVTVLYPPPHKELPDLNRVKLKITKEELCVTNHPSGVVWFGKLRPLMEWLTSKGVKQ